MKERDNMNTAKESEDGYYHCECLCVDARVKDSGTYREDVLSVAAVLAKLGGTIEIEKHVFGFVIKLIPLDDGKFRVVI